jgi:hypothetical protein
MSACEITILLKDVIFPLGDILVSLIAIITTLIINKRAQRRNILEQILQEYRSEKMGTALVEIWNFYNRTKTTKEFIDHYVNDTKINGSLSSSVHIKRRYISHFYQIVATYYYEKYISRKKLKKIWSKSSLNVISEILYPIETEAIGIIKNQQNFIVSEHTKNMFRLYNELANPAKKLEVNYPYAKNNNVKGKNRVLKK